ncbi:MAG: MFS transporter, partial [Solirubrobacteraceae bacterium]|nr:MFS transporter [Solirubrobacteraceae bacterium]
MPIALLALTVGAFGIGTTEFVLMGLLQQVADDLHVSIAAAGLLISGYAVGVAIGAPVLTLASRRLPRKTVLLALMAIFTLGNLACALAPSYGWLMAARVVTALAHGTFFGVGAVVATGLVAPERRASAIAIMFTGLTAATILGVPAGAWLGLHHGWRAPFWAVAAIGVLAFAVLAAFVPRSRRDGVLPPLRDELAVLGRPQVLLGLAMTVVGYAGVFAVFTYVQPLLNRLTGLSDGAVSAVLLLFGGGMAIGNLLGGRLADRGVMRAVLWTLSVLALVLATMQFAIGSAVPAIVFFAVLGVASFATVAPLQMRVLEKASGAGQNLAS